MEIEPWPGLLRVFLYSRRYDRVAPRSLIGLGRGTNSLTRFQAQLEKRSLKKLGFGIAGDYYNSGRFSNSYRQLLPEHAGMGAGQLRAVAALRARGAVRHVVAEPEG